MMEKRLFLDLLTLVSCLYLLIPAQGQPLPYFEYTAHTKEIYQDIIDLKLDLAHSKLVVHATSYKEAGNLAYHHIASYMDFFRVFISEEQADFRTFITNKNTRIKALEHLSDEDPHKRYAIAELKLQSALIRAKFDEVFGASREVYSAYKLLKKNAEKHPDFIYNNKSLSVIHTLVETVSLPGVLKKLLRIQGSLELGLQEIESILSYSHQESDFIFQAEVDAIYLYILMYQASQQELALNYLEQARLDPKGSLLSVFMISKLNQRAGNNEKALQLLQNRPTGAVYADFPFLDYMQGLSLMRKGDWVAARSSFDLFLEEFHGRHYIKEAHQKYAWCRLMEGNAPAYAHHITLVKEAGHTVVDADKQAMNEAQNSAIPDELLLHARILYDGGYYTQALTLLTKNAHKYGDDQREIVEFNYRMGRITQALKNYTDAMLYFSATMNTELELYQSCNAALQIGFIYEEQGQYGNAKKYFEKCLEMDPDNYKNSLHQKAKSGKMRIESHIK